MNRAFLLVAAGLIGLAAFAMGRTQTPAPPECCLPVTSCDKGGCKCEARLVALEQEVAELREALKAKEEAPREAPPKAEPPKVEPPKAEAPKAAPRAVVSCNGTSCRPVQQSRRPLRRLFGR